jgi:hypothetical protein
VLSEQPEQQLIVQRHRPRVIAKGREGQVVFWHYSQHVRISHLSQPDGRLSSV